MNPEDPNEPHLTPVGDAELEARIVAWVLGEASAFEAAELARLCEENPELRLFEQRIRSVHGLVAQDFHPLPGEDWRLPEEKRIRVTALFGDEVAAEKARQKRVNRYFTRRALLATAACITVAAVSWKIASPLQRSESKTAMSPASEQAPDFMPAGGRGGDASAARESNIPYLSESARREPLRSKPQDAVPKHAQSELKSQVDAGRATDKVRYKVDAGEKPSQDLAKTKSAEGAVAQRSLSAASEQLLPSAPPPPAAAPAAAMDALAAGGTLSGNGAANGLGVDEQIRRANAADEDRRDALAEADIPLNGPVDRFSRASGIAGHGVGSGSGPATAPESKFRSRGFVEPEGARVPSQEPMGEMESLAARAKAEQPASGADAHFDQDGRDKTELAFRDAKTRLSDDMDGFAGGGEDNFAPSAAKGAGSGGGSGGGLGTGKASVMGRAITSPSDAPSQNNPALRAAEGAYKLGKLDDAKKAYEEVLRADPSNKAAKRGLEQAQNAKSDYHRAAYDQSRAEILADVDEAWELSVPRAKDSKPAESGKDQLGVLPMADANQPGPEPGSYAELAQKEMLPRRQNGVTQYTGFALQGLANDAAGFGYLDSSASLDADRRASATFFGGFNLGDLGGVPASQTTAGGAISATGGRLSGNSDFYNFNSTSEHYLLAGREYLMPDNAAGQPYSWDKPLYAQGNADAGLPGEMSALSTLNPVPPPADAPAKPAIVEEQEKPAIEPLKEISAADEAFSTFSLHVSDVSFRLAKAALDRGEQPAPESIREEEFYNAVDYGDAPAGDQPVACVIEESAHPYRPQRELVRIGVRTGSSGRSQSTPLHLVLLLDSSGSMERDDRHTGLLNAVKELSTLLKDGDTITVVGFSRTPRLLVDRLSGKDAAKLNEIVRNSPVEGGTDLAQGLKLSAELATRQFSPDAQNRIVLFTDGAANLGDADPKSLADLVVKMRQQHIAFDAAGFGADGLNDKMLEQLTRDGDGRYYVVNRPEDADGGFAHQLAGAFRPAAENVKVQVRFNPSRVGKYRLAGFAEHRLQKEDFHNDSVDAAEMAAEEAGNALYDVETLPQGEGEVGEVSVRFRDASNGQMVERTWTIPYDPATPAFDRAKPSMQLAGLALMAAEKLKSGPGAGAIDFGQFANPLAVVRQAYGRNSSTSQLLEMIGKLR